MSSRGLNRRGHLSSKVPNVKLRPSSSALPSKVHEAEPRNAMDQELQRRAWEAGDDEDVSSAALRSTRKPWERVIITFTGVDDKPHLTELARNLGATITPALTKETTHVVANQFGSAKYLYAVEHRIPVMRPEWISEMHATWKDAGEVDMISSMEGRKLLPFTGLTISISGVEPMDRRKQVIAQITLNGGTYAKDLDKTSTHLVTVQPTNIRKPSEKVKWAVGQLKERESRQRAGKSVDDEDMKIVYEDWIWDCVGYEGRWKEDWYDAQKVRRTSRTKYDEVMSGEAKQRMLQAFARIDAVIQEEPAVLKKRKRDNMDHLVGDIISTSTGSSSKPVRASNQLKFAPTGMDFDTEDAEGTVVAEPSRRPILDPTDRPGPMRKTSILHSSRTGSFATPSAGPSKLSREVFAESPSSASLPATLPPSRSGGPSRLGRTRLFAGIGKFVLHIEEDVAIMQREMARHSATVVSMEDWKNGEKVDYVIVRLYSLSPPDLSFIPEDERPQVVTECWVEACASAQRIIPLDSHVCFTPLKGDFPIPGLGETDVHVAGFSGPDRVYLKRLARVVGLNVSDKLGRHTTHLISPEPSGQKYEKATDWGVPVVHDNWLLAMVRTSALHDYEPYRLVAGQPVPVSERETLEWLFVKETSASTAVNRAAREGTEGDVTKETSPVAGGGDFEMGSSAPVEPPRSSRLEVDDMLETPAAVADSPNPSAFRKLKLTPTHVDPIPSTTSDRASVSIGSTSFPLSPPNQDTERLLNQATTLAKPARRLRSDPEPVSQSKRKVHAESVESKLSRNASAPPAPDQPASIPTADLTRTTSLTAKQGLGRPEMSEMLKLLAQPSDTSSSSSATPTSRSTKPLRRARPSGASGASSRLRTSMAYSPAAERDVSEVGDTTTDTNFRFSHSPPPQQFQLPDGGYDESVRINYVDPVADREKRKLLESIRKGAAAAEKARTAEMSGRGGEEGVPDKEKVKKRRK